METNTCVVTIIVPIYNVEKYLRNCIDSIIRQTYKNIEIILVNDGSTDSSLEICEEYVNDNRVIIIDKQNEGLSSARQIGIDRANGKYICTVDSDDYIADDFIDKMLLKIELEKADICVCATRAYSSTGYIIQGFDEHVPLIHEIEIEDIERNYFILLSQYFMSDSWNKIYRTEFIKNSGVRFTLSKEYNGTDLLFNHLLLLHLPKMAVIKEYLYNYQILDNSRVRRKNKQLQNGFMLIVSEIVKEVDRLNYSHAINIQISNIYANLLRYVCQDFTNDRLSYKELKLKLFNFYIDHRNFLKQQTRITLNTKYISTISLRVFCLLINAYSKSALIIYLKLRQIIIFLK